MKAAVLTSFNRVEVMDLAMPEELKPGQVMVKVLGSTICGAQIGEITGAKGPDPFMPHLMGHEGCGEIIRLGPGCRRELKPGGRVVMHWRKGPGIDAEPVKYMAQDNMPDVGQRYPGHRVVGAGPVHTFCEYAIVSENRLTPISPAVPPRVASLFGCAVTTGLGIVNKEAQLQIGQSITVIGVGGVGLNVVQGAALVGAYPIIAVDRIPEKLEMAKLFGATHTILVNDLPSDDPISDGIQTATGKANVDVVVDCTGNPVLINYGLIHTAPGGRLILVGQPKYGENLIFTNFRRHYVGKTILDSQGGLTDPAVDIPRYAQMYLEGHLTLDGMVTQVFDLEHITSAIVAVQTGRVGRVYLEMGHGE